MESNHLHIVSFNVPWPNNYGGVIDVYYKLRALHAAGVRVHLHCFTYGRQESEQLNALCESVHYYKRASFAKGFFSERPFIVQSRNSPALLEQLQMDQYPILFEGLHSCYFLPDESLRNRLKIVRMHNNEAAYYMQLGKNEKRFFRKLYFYRESVRLMRFEKMLEYAQAILCISPSETKHYQRKFNSVQYLAPFHGNVSVTSRPGLGDYILYHGNLEVNENDSAAKWIVGAIAGKSAMKVIIAGNNPSAGLRSIVQQQQNTQLIASPDPSRLSQLIAEAHIHLLPTFTETGIKLKLMNALFNGRHCLVNTQMVEATGLEKYVHIADAPDALVSKLNELSVTPFTQEDILFRKPIETEFSDQREAEKIINLL